jgi:hypothetical protein
MKARKEKLKICNSTKDESDIKEQNLCDDSEDDLKTELRNVFIVMTSEMKNYGTGVQVVEFGCTRSALDGTLLILTCVMSASRSFISLFSVVL